MPVAIAAKWLNACTPKAYEDAYASRVLKGMKVPELSRDHRETGSVWIWQGLDWALGGREYELAKNSSGGFAAKRLDSAPF
jgi:hypothetical protein